MEANEKGNEMTQKQKVTVTFPARFLSPGARAESMEAVEEKLRALSTTLGGAWAFAVVPFSTTVEFFQYSSPGRVPDAFLEMGFNPRIGWKGKIVDFTPAARIRQQNRGLTCE